MEYRTMEISSISAKGLKDVNLISKMDVYVVVSIDGDSRSKQKTPVDRDGGTNPSWNIPMKFTVDESAAAHNRLTLSFKLRCERVLGDKDIGEVNVPVQELLDAAAGDDYSRPARFVSYQVRKPSGKPKGELSFSYKFGEIPVSHSTAAAAKGDLGPVTAYPPTAAVAPKAREAPVTAYPAASSSAYPPVGAYPQTATGYAYQPQPAHGYGYPPHPAPAGYGYPPAQAGYGYPPPQSGYGYPPTAPAQKPAKKNKFGLGLGAGLLGGVLGGLLIGDLVSGGPGFDGPGFDGPGFDGPGFGDF